MALFSNTVGGALMSYDLDGCLYLSKVSPHLLILVFFHAYELHN